MNQTQTRIVRVINLAGEPILIGNRSMFEVASGPHRGTRGTDSELYDLGGPIHWDRSENAIFETGDYVPAEKGDCQ